MRRILLVGGVAECPYQKIEYLEVNADSGWAYIETDYIPHDYDNDIFITLTFLGYGGETGSRTRLLGAYTSETANAYRILRKSYSQDEFILQNGVMGGPHSTETSIKLEIGKKTEIVMKHDGSYFLDGEKFVLDTYRSSIPNSTNLCLFLHVSTPYIPFFKLHSFKWVKSGITIFDLTPVRIENEGYMYDKVSGKLFGNSGTGKFILGPDI